MTDNIRMKDWGALEALNKAWAQDAKHKADYFKHILNSVIRDGERSTTSIADRVKEWVLTTDGEWFTCRNVYDAIQVQSGQPRATAWQAIHRLVENDTLEKDPNMAGKYRRRMDELLEMDLEGEDLEPMRIDLPFGLTSLVDIYPKSIILLAGYSDAGKTAICLDIAKRNMEDFDVRYFNCEMGAKEFKRRLRAHEDVQDWMFKAYERSDNFADVIFPDAINIVDYIPMGEGFYMVGQKLRDIHDRLSGGIAVVGLQKAYGHELGRGGAFSLELPRLYLSIDPGVLKIVKAKNWADPSFNPNRQVIDFKLVGGWKIIPVGTWRQDSAREVEMNTFNKYKGGY